MHIVWQILSDFWSLSEEMAPYLLLGFSIAAVLRLVVDESFVRKHLGQKGWRQTVKAAILGVPLPLCSCGVIPVAASLRRQGGSAGAVTSFTASTPQTGVDSIFATAALLNWPFALIRVIVAFVNGIVAGTLVDRFADHPPAESASQAPETEGCCSATENKSETPSCCASAQSASREVLYSAASARFTFASPAEGKTAIFTPVTTATECACGCGAEEAPKTGCCSEEDGPATSSCCSPSPITEDKPARVRDAFRFGFLTLPADIGKALLFGLLLAAVLGVALPNQLAPSSWTTGILAYLATTLVAVPIYVCSTGSIPMAYALVSAGFSPGAALVFLIAGPATNTATLSALWKMIGPRAVLIYVATLVIIAWVAGFLLDRSGLQMQFSGHHAHGAARAWWKFASAVVLYSLLGYTFWRSARNRQKRAR